MCFLFVPGLAASTLASELPLPERARSVTSRGRHMPPRYWSRAWRKGGWIRRLSGLTLPPSTLDRGVASWIASCRVTHANRTATPASVSAKPMTDGYSTESWRSSTPAGLILSSARTFAGMRTGSSPLPSRHWKQWASALRLEYSARRKSARAIGGSGCSSWPTARAEDAESAGRRHGRGVSDTLTAVTREWQTPRTVHGEYTRDNGDPSKPRLTLNGEAMMWATPRASDNENRTTRIAPSHGHGHGHVLAGQACSWTTPMAARDHKSIQASDATHARNSRPLSEMVGLYSRPDQTTHDGPPSSPQSRVLNPLFVDFLMGLPIGWTGCEPLETRWSRFASLMRGALSTLGSRPAQARLL